jgi:predicted lysophospholipase L1 biosynthesis ABC-type transport system permease subunit
MRRAYTAIQLALLASMIAAPYMLFRETRGGVLLIFWVAVTLLVGSLAIWHLRRVAGCGEG